MTVASATGWVGLVLVLGAVAFAIWAVFNDKRRSSLTDTYKGLYEAQKEATAQARDEADQEKTARMQEQAECKARIDALDKQMELLQGQWIQSVAAGVAEAVTRYIEKQEHP